MGDEGHLFACPREDLCEDFDWRENHLQMIVAERLCLSIFGNSPGVFLFARPACSLAVNG